mgnify:CR=1 FL=1
MNILDEIIKYKKIEVAKAKEFKSYSELEKEAENTPSGHSLKNSILQRGSPAVIAEVKRKSPSKGVINDKVSVVDLAVGYEKAGASGLSILTDDKFFAGSLNDLEKASRKVKIPLLRKDFIIDEYQLLEAKACGADVILLIARVLDPKRTFELARFARGLGLEILLEVHNERELEGFLSKEIDLVGVNNRDLDSFQVDIELSFNLISLIPPDFVSVSESGIDSASTLVQLYKAGYKAFLIGETFMKTADPAEACASLLKSVHDIVLR